MKRNSFLLCILTLVATMAAKAEDFKFTEGKWSVTYSDTLKGLTIEYDGRTLFKNAYASVVYNKKGNSSTSTIRSGSTILPTITSTAVSDSLGTGTQCRFAYKKEDVTMSHLLTFYTDKPYMIASVTLACDEDVEVESRRMTAMATDTETTPLNGKSNRMLWVPFDNDGHIKYKNLTLTGNTDNTSHEVTAIFDGDSRFGIVAGSIDHDTWKSGIRVRGKDGYKLTRLYCISGYTSSDTRDIRSHGKISGKEISSARYFIGLFDDWREGLNTFATTNAIIAPPAEWTKGNPIGWSSWGVMQTVVNYKGVEETARFIKDSLFKSGFYDREKKTTISLDAFAEDNISQDEFKTLGTKTFAKGTYIADGAKKFGTNQTLGLYYGPFVIWEWILDNKVKGTGENGIPEYTWRDAALKVNGNIYKLPSNGGYASDPTHPAVKACIEYTLKLWSSWGIKYVKADFLNNGIIEGDKWYNPEITTGVQAYNYGMKIYLETAKKYGMYIVESISPIFPYQYAHGRRVSCDRFSEIAESEYVMNAVSYGWWTDKLYAVNDPDHLVMCKQGHGANETIGENRARATTGMVTGAFIFGDNFSLSGLKDGTKPGYPEESRKRAKAIMGNADINEYVRNNTGSFMPLNGDDPSESQQAESFFVRDTEEYFYLAIFNYNTTVKKGEVSFSRMGIAPESVGEIKELWLNKSVTYNSEGVTYNVPAKDARVYRIKKNTNTGITETETADTTIDIQNIGDNAIRVTSDAEITSVTIYNAAGIMHSTINSNGEKSIEVQLPANRGIYIIKTLLTNGDVAVRKYK
ncbi:MAG: hypothetical protein IJW68_01830 [Bacteroidaceae bacterium]|nr:hypothetical protein [Bacteroidaceae bacterium]